MSKLKNCFFYEFHFEALKLPLFPPLLILETGGKRLSELALTMCINCIVTLSVNPRGRALRKLLVGFPSAPCADNKDKLPSKDGRNRYETTFLKPVKTFTAARQSNV